MELSTKNRKLAVGTAVAASCVLGGYLLYRHYTKKPQMPNASKGCLGLINPCGEKDHVNIKYVDAERRFESIENVAYDLQVSIPMGERFYGITKVSFDCKHPLSTDYAFHLDFAGDEIYSISVNGCCITKGYKFGKHKLPIPVDKLKAKGNIVEIAYTNKYSRNGCGLHSYVDPADNEQYLYSQFESPYCHTFMPCFDQPSLKATLTLTVLAPENWIVIANQPETSNEVYTDGTLPNLLSSPFMDSPSKLWVFSTTPRLSTYLYAICAGNYFMRKPDSSMNLVTPMRLFCRQSYQKYLGEDYAQDWFEVSDHGLRFHGDLMGEKYPYDKLDQVICPEYNWGAMENVGCITYTEYYLFKTKPTRGKRVRVHCTILHELAHQWFGNLVTMHWWEDLWLNESFATYVAMLAQLKYKDEGEDANIDFLGETVWGIFTDQRETTHPIANEAKLVSDTEVAETIFDGISYGKGGSWLKQLYKYAGPEVFRSGIQGYFKEFRGGNTQLKDFINSMDTAAKAVAKANNTQPPDLVKWANGWLLEKGVMIVSADVEIEEGKIKNFVIEQDFAKYADKNYKEHKLDIVIYDEDMKATRKEVTVLAEAKTSLVEEFAGLDCKAVMLNSGCHSYCKVALDPSWVEFMINNFSSVVNNFDKNYLCAIMYDMVRDGKLNPILFVKSIQEHVLKETQVMILQNSVGRSITVAKDFIHPTHRKKYCNLLFNALVDALNTAEEKDTEKKTLLVTQILCLLTTDENLQKAHDWLSSGNIEGAHELEMVQKRNILVRLCGASWLDEGEKDSLVKAYIGEDTDSDAKNYSLKCEVARPNKENKKKWWNWLIDPPKEASQQEFGFVCGAFTIGLSADLGKTFAGSYFENLLKIFEDKGHFYGRRFMSGLYPGHANPSPENLMALEEIVSANKSKGDKRNKFLEESGVQLQDIQRRFQSGWELSKNE